MKGIVGRVFNWRIGCIVAVLLALAIVSPAQSAEAFRSLKMGDVAPGFTLKTTGGDDVQYEAPPEVAIVLAFIKPGQEKSEAVARDLARLGGEVAEKSQILAILVGSDGVDGAAWVKNLGLKYPVLLDKDDEVYGTYGVMVAPQTAVLDAKGVLKAEINGHVDGYTRQVENALREVLGMEQLKDESTEAAVELPKERKVAMREVAKARMFIKRRMKSKALPQVRKAVASDPTYLDGQLLLGELLLDEGDDANLAEAETSFAKAAELDPSNIMVKVGLARIMVAKGDAAGAVGVLDKAAMISPNAGKLYYYLGQIHEKTGNLQGAVDAYRKALHKLLKIKK